MSFNLARLAASVTRRQPFSTAASVTNAGKGKFVVTTQPYDSPKSTDDAVSGEFWAGEPGVKQKREEAPYESIDGRSTLDVMARAHRVNAIQDSA